MAPSLTSQSSVRVIGVILAECDGQRGAARVFGIVGDDVAGARRRGVERLGGESHLGAFPRARRALAACRAGHREPRAALDEHRFVGRVAAGREGEFIARGRRHGEPGIVEIGEELLRGADYHLRIGHRGGQVCIYRAPGQHFDLLFGIIVRFAGSFRIGVAVGDRDGVAAHPEDGFALLELGERIPFLRARFARYRERESPGCGRFGRA